MAVANPSMHARSGADALARLVRDVRTGRAQWTHPQHVRQSTDELVRAAEAFATALQEMTAAHASLDQAAPQARQAGNVLHQAAQSATLAASQLRQARRFM